MSERTQRKDPIALQEHVIFYASLLHRCIIELNDTRTIMTVVENMGFEHASVKVKDEDYQIWWDVSLEVVTKRLPPEAKEPFVKFFEFLERAFAMGLQEASEEIDIISRCRLDMSQIHELQVFSHFSFFFSESTCHSRRKLV